MSRPARIPQILLVEDSEDDVFFFQRLVKKGGLEIDTIHVSNGLAAIELLKRSRPPEGQGDRPDLVLLDLKMPDYDGFDVLTWVQNAHFQPPLKIAVLSGSEADSDVLKAAKLGALACYAKPMQLGQLKILLANCGFAPQDFQPNSP